jgi:hypothetical protein
MNIRIINWKTVASDWWFIWIVRWCTDLQILNSECTSYAIYNKVLFSCMFIYLFLYLLLIHSINPLEAAKPIGYRISKSPSNQHTHSNQHTNRLKMDFNDHGSKVINDYIEFQYFYINISVNRYILSHVIQTYKTEKVCNKICASHDSNQSVLNMMLK